MDGHFSERKFKRTPHGGGALKTICPHSSGHSLPSSLRQARFMGPARLASVTTSESLLEFQCGQARVVFTERLKLEGNINLHIFLQRR